jgi:hypothetical protein
MDKRELTSWRFNSMSSHVGAAVDSTALADFLAILLNYVDCL